SSLQKQFGNTLLWFNALQDATTRHVDNFLGLKHSMLIARNVTSITQEELDKPTEELDKPTEELDKPTEELDKPTSPE
ncbi:hypothetical protein C0991_012590, partial [Blastosporella zonata]